MSAATIHDPTHAYRSNARKLRGRFASRPAELYRSLRELSDHHDLIRRFESPAQIPTTPTSEFASEVREFLQSGIVTYSSRQNLLKSAEMRGIPRFEANLIIAAVQHRVPARKIEPKVFHRSKLSLVMGFILSQLVIILTAWVLAAR